MTLRKLNTPTFIERRFPSIAAWLIIAVMLIVSMHVAAQTITPVRWLTYQTKFNNPIVTARESGNYIVFGLEGTTASQWVLKSAFMKTTTVRDTVRIPTICPVCPPPLDVKKSSEYIALAQINANLIIDNAVLRAEVDRLIAADFERTKQYTEMVRQYKLLRAEHDKYQLIQFLVDTTLVKIRKP